MPDKQKAIELLEELNRQHATAAQLLEALIEQGFVQPTCRKDGKYEWNADEDNNTDTR
jgi:predicted transcriptional regulator